MMKNEKTILASVEIEKIDDGYLARIPGIQGAFADGGTIDEALFNLVDVAKMIFEYRQERNEPLGFNEFTLKKNTKLTFSLPLGL